MLEAYLETVNVQIFIPLFIVSWVFWAPVFGEHGLISYWDRCKPRWKIFAYALPCAIVTTLIIGPFLG